MARKIAPPDDLDPYASPVNPVPAVIWIPAAVMALLELVFQAGARGILGGPQAVGWRSNAINEYGFFDPVFEQLRIGGWWIPEHLLRFVTYPFLHLSIGHALFGIVLLLALGNYVARVFPPWSVLLGLVAASFAGAVSYGLVAESQHVLIGATTMDYGLIGMLTVLLWLEARMEGKHPARALRLIIVLTLLQVAFFGATKVTGDETVGLAQQIAPGTAAFFAGVAVGWLTFPGHLRRLVARLRDR